MRAMNIHRCHTGAAYFNSYRLRVLVISVLFVLLLAVVIILISLNPHVNRPLYLIRYDIQKNQQTNSELKTNSTTHYKSCQTKQCHVAFLKVHKAGSSTMQNIFSRFGINHGLTFVLPVKNNYVKQDKPILPVKPEGHYDILAMHSVYNKQFYAKLLPVDSVNIGIVREPFNRVISAAYYYRYTFHTKYLAKIPEQSFIRQLVNMAEIYDTEPFSHTKNAMGRDFGFDPNIKVTDVAQINSHMELLKENLKLVLVMERFDESLVLMKRYLKWSIYDVLYIKINENKHDAVKRSTLNMQKFHNTNFLDYILYETFTRELNKKVDQEGSDFQDEVVHFKSLLDKIGLFCKDTMGKDKKTIVPESKWDTAFVVSRQDCETIRMDETTMLDTLRIRHKNMHPQTD